MMIVSPAMKRYVLALAGLIVVSVPVYGQKGSEWYQQAAKELVHKKNIRPVKRRARGIILFIGDGMSNATVAAVRIYQGQKLGGNGEENQLSFERFPHLALSKTYNTDSQVPDSAGTASAILTGSKTRIGVISVAENVPRGNCTLALQHEVETLLEQAEDRGWSTGIVTTTRVTHATPAAAYAHAPERAWEADSDLPQTVVEQGCKDVAEQLVAFRHGDGIDLVMGGGRTNFRPIEITDEEYGIPGRRDDGKDLIASWQDKYPDGRYIWNLDQFNELRKNPPARLLALFQPSHMQYEVDRANDKAGEPSLAEMTDMAINMLSRNKKGFFLLVEGGRIDHAHHRNNAARALEDALAFSDAIALADVRTSQKDVLLLVTADHSHTLMIGGYPDRGNPVLGVVKEHGKVARAADGKAYTTLSYANGPGAVSTYNRPNPEFEDTDSVDYRQQAHIPLHTETHAGDDVAIYARGPSAWLVDGVVEQNYIYHVMRDAGRFSSR